MFLSFLSVLQQMQLGTTPSLQTSLEEKAPSIMRENEQTMMLFISSIKFLVKAAVIDLIGKHGFIEDGHRIFQAHR